MRAWTRERIDFRDRGEVSCGHVATVIRTHLADIDDRMRVFERMRA